MPVPPEIRQVPRPVNTIVEDSLRDGPHRYRVRSRLGVKYVPGKNPQPINGPVIGYIYQGVFVKRDEKDISSPSKGKADMLSYGVAALVRSVSSDLFKDLIECFPLEDACRIMAVATLRITKPEIKSNRFGSEYKRSFVSHHYPGLALSKNTVTKLFERIGQEGLRRKNFYLARAKAVCETHHIAIDGTLKQDTSSVNDLSAFSRKGRVKGCADVSVLYAYDIENHEPICAEVFPGNTIDASSYREFIRHNDIRRGIIVADKGFPPSQIAEELGQRPELHFLTPLKRNDKRIANNNLLQFQGLLQGIGEPVLYSKCAINGGKRFLYAFKNASKAHGEDRGYLLKQQEAKQYDNETYENKKKVFGVIVFESDQDLSPETIYMCYEDRWMLELVFRHYKNDIGLDRTNVQSDFVLIGSEFINFIATTITCRILRKAQLAGVLNTMTYPEMMDELRMAWRLTDAPERPKTEDKWWIHTYKAGFEILEALDLCDPLPKEAPKKRGRPRKNPGETEIGAAIDNGNTHSIKSRL